MPTSEERVTGRMEIEVAHIKEQMETMHNDLETLKEDVNDIKVMMAEVRTELRLLTKRQSPWEIVYGFGLAAAGAGGFVYAELNQWIAGGMVVAGAIVIQRGQLAKIVTQYVARKNGTHES